MFKHHSIQLTEIENLIPFEREAFIIMIEQHIEEEKKQQDEIAKKYGK